MSRFLDPLEVRVLDEIDRGRLVYQVLARFRYESDLLGGTVEVPAGFVTDLESIPRTLAAYTGPPCPGAGVVHDFLYQAHRVGLGGLNASTFVALVRETLDPQITVQAEPLAGRAVRKADADRVYQEAMICRGIDPVFAQQRFNSVDFYGKPAWDSGPSRLRIVIG